MPKCTKCGIIVKTSRDFEGDVMCTKCKRIEDQDSLLDSSKMSESMSDIVHADLAETELKVLASEIETPSHYTQEGKPQTVDKQKAVGEILEGHLTGNEIHFILTALKYFDRAGEKIYDGMSEEESFNKDMEKTADYLYQLKHEEFLNQKN